MRRTGQATFFVVLTLLALPPVLRGQVPHGDSLPTALATAAMSEADLAGWVRARGSAAAALKRPIGIELHDVTVSDALTAIGRQADLRVEYGADVVAASGRISLHVDNWSVTDALAAVLTGTRLEAYVSLAGDAILVRSSTRRSLSQHPRQATGIIDGRVADATTHRPVPYANVLIESLGRRGVTSDSGTYRIANVPSGTYIAVARVLGYVAGRRTVTVLENQVVAVDFVLRKSASQLDQVVVTATGEARRAEVGNVIAEVNVDSLIPNAPVNSFNDILTARVPGVEVLQANGYTGMAADIRIRGLNSMTVSNDPIIIMDGVRLDNRPGDLGLNGAQNQVANYSGIWTTFGQISGSLVNINPDEIETLEVVKGPSATTLYGTDAANGVIVIKTKHGQASKPRATVYTEQGVVRSTGGIPDNYYAWGHAVSTGAPTQCLLTSEAAGLCTIDSVTHFNPLNNPATTPIQTGNRRVYGGQVSGGDAVLRYFGSGEYEGERGYLQMPKSEQQRILVQEGGNIPGYEINPNIMQKGSLRGNLVANLGPDADVTVSTGFLSNLARIPAGDFVFGSGEYGAGYRDATDGWNPGYGRPGDVFAVRGDQHANRFTGSVTNHWHPLGWLQTHETVGLDFTSTFLDGLQRYGEGLAFFGTPAGSRWNSRGTTALSSVDLSVKGTASPIADVTSTTSIGAQYNRTAIGQTTASGMGLIPGLGVGNGAASEFIGEVNQANVVAGAYVEQNIGWRERLFVTGALRADGSSAFGSNFRTALYPKVSLSWVVSQEPFLRRASSWLTTVRVRGAYGASGVQPDPTAKLSLLAAAPSFVDGVQQTGALIQTLANNELKPERQAELETGFDAEMWHGRLRLEATYYNRQSSDALINIPLAASTGIHLQEQNIGSVRNRGVEGSISSRLVSWSVVSFDVQVNGSINHNTILSLAPGMSDIPSIYPFLQQRVRYPVFGVWTQPILGYHANNQGIVGTNDITIGDTAVYQGWSLPTRQFSINGALSFLNGHVRLSSLLDYRGGYKFLDFGEGFYRCQLYNNCRAVNDPTTPLFQQAQAVEANLTGSYVTVNDGTYLRWRELALTLDVPDRWARAFRTRGMSLTLSGRNLGLWTKVPGLQPERSNLDHSIADYRFAVPTAPLSRYWLARINLAL